MTETLTDEEIETEIASEMTEETGDEAERDEDGNPIVAEPGAAEDDEPEASARLSEKELEKRNTALDKESARHEKRIHEILGADGVDLIDCEACHPGVPGYHFPADNYPPGAPERALYEMLSAGEAAQMRHPDYLETCGECNGFGQVLTGARTDLTRLLPCPVCKTAGYIDTRQHAPGAIASVIENGDAAAAVAPPADAQPEQDMWGRPVGHVRFGKFPIYLTDEERAADFAEGFTID